jgi:signal transduction histidine kinase
MTQFKWFADFSKKKIFKRYAASFLSISIIPFLIIFAAGIFLLYNKTAVNSGMLYIVLGCALLLVSIIILVKKMDEVFRPIDDIAEAVKKAVKGEYSEISISGLNDSTDDVIKNYNILISGISRQLDELNKSEEELKNTMDELKRSNSDLEQFAYISSHDLQEPLRSITGYLQLIDRKYRGRLDIDADAYINSTIAASQRMKDIINDVLQYSQISKKKEPFRDVDMNAAVAQAVLNLKTSIEHDKAKIIYSNLPVVYGDFGQLSRMFQNLIGNSIKFRMPEEPVIEITSSDNAREYIFKVKDNGIGIDPEYNEKVFAIFQRLHSRREYQGTGIGLAVCKKIVECHNGKIWLESEAKKGTRFYFTIPKRRA